MLANLVVVPRLVSLFPFGINLSHEPRTVCAMQVASAGRLDVVTTIGPVESQVA